VRTSCLGLSRKAAAHATTDEDEQADYSNDLGQLAIAQWRLEQEACRAFGPQVKVFSRDPISVSPEP
jgi:hypothetical protein